MSDTWSQVKIGVCILRDSSEEAIRTAEVLRLRAYCMSAEAKCVCMHGSPVYTGFRQLLASMHCQAQAGQKHWPLARVIDAKTQHLSPNPVMSRSIPQAVG